MEENSKKLVNKKSNLDELKKIDKRITNREFKILLKPDGLDRHREVEKIQKIVESLASQMKLNFIAPESMSPGLRNVYFFDTECESLRRNKLILRVRETRSQIWTDDWCELTFKCRSDDIDRSWGHNPLPNSDLHHRIRFKEEILKDGPIGSMRSIYSHNSIMETVPVDKIHEKKVLSVGNLYPGLLSVNVPHNKFLKIVGGPTNKILEAQVTLGQICFGDNVQAHCELAIWFKSVGEPIVGELAFAYRVHKKNRKDVKTHKVAEDFFKYLQHSLSKSIFDGTTKTALIYGAKE